MGILISSAYLFHSTYDENTLYIKKYNTSQLENYKILKIISIVQGSEEFDTIIVLNLHEKEHSQPKVNQRLNGSRGREN